MSGGTVSMVGKHAPLVEPLRAAAASLIAAAAAVGDKVGGSASARGRRLAAYSLALQVIIGEADGEGFDEAGAAEILARALAAVAVQASPNAPAAWLELVRRRAGDHTAPAAQACVTGFETRGSA